MLSFPFRITYAKAPKPSQTQPSTYNLSRLPARCAGAMVAQNLWEGSTNDWPNLRPTRVKVLIHLGDFGHILSPSWVLAVKCYDAHNGLVTEFLVHIVSIDSTQAREVQTGTHDVKARLFSGNLITFIQVKGEPRSSNLNLLVLY